jgi:putative CocE/NonD family hydrolase
VSLSVQMDSSVGEHSAALMPVLAPEVRSLTLRDGTRLDADIYRPATGGPYPVLLMRQAYGRRIGCTLCYAHPAWYAANGYIVVVQDIRGRGTSEGFFKAGENDIADGVETVDWVAGLEGSTGDVGMYGFSYQGYVQMMAAIEAGPALKALAPAMSPWHARETWAYENGALRLQGALGWATQIAAETARHAGDAEAYAELLAESRALNVRGSVQARPAYMERHRGLSHYHRWLDTPADDPYWIAISPAAHAKAIAAKNIPTLFIGGWYDTHLRSTWEAYCDLLNEGHTRLRMSFGPWLHFPWDRKTGAIDFGPAAAASMDVEHIRFFDQWLKGKQSEEAEPIQLFDLGVHRWRGLAALPDNEMTFSLSGSGRATIDKSDGVLSTQAHAQPGIDYVVNDPWRPAPAFGGAFGTPPGPVDRAHIDARGDIATFTTAPFEEALTLAGAVKARLHVTCDAASFDIGCVLSRVTKAGQVFQLADGYRTVKDGEPRDVVEVPMRATCVTFQPGDALRLSISGASFPAYPLNPGTGEDPTKTASVRARVITLGVKYGEGDPSCLVVTIAD